MDEKEKVTIPYIAHESEMARLERIIKRLWITVFVLLGIVVATNGAWLWYESQYVDEVTETVETTADGGGNAYGTIITGNDSEVHYGESEGNTN